MRKFCQDDSSDLVSIGILWIESRDDIKRVVEPLIVLSADLSLSKHLNHAQPQNIGCDVLIAKKNGLEVFAGRQNPKLLHANDREILTVIDFTKGQQHTGERDR